MLWFVSDLTAGNTGSLRYMAPEVATCQKYDQSVDVYSFALLLWQVLTGHTPFEHLRTRKELLEAVGVEVDGGGEAEDRDGDGERSPPQQQRPQQSPPERPSLRALRGKQPQVEVITKVLSRCWSSEPSIRMSMTEVAGILEELHLDVLASEHDHHHGVMGNLLGCGGSS